MQKLTQITLFFILLTTVSFTASAQNEEAIKNAKAKYNRSIRYNDYQVAKNAIYDLMALEPNKASYMDSLAYIYFEFNQFASAALVSRDVLKISPNNQLMLQIAAKSFDQLGAAEQSLNMYQRLYNVTDDAFVLYEVIQKQYTLKKLDDAMINTELLLGKDVVNNSTVYAKDSEGNDIEVPFKAVVLNLQGLIARAQGNEESAKKYFNSALKIAPNYGLPKENLNPAK